MANNDADFLREARERFQSGIDADRQNRKRDEDDRKFFKGEQWTPTEVKERAGRITLRINRLPQFVKQVTGEMRQNKPAIRVLPKEEGREQLAEVYAAIIRHVESISDAHRVYNKAAEQAVIGGIGWFRILTDYLDDSSFEQEIVIKPIRNPLSVVIDPDARELTRQDMNWAFVTELVSRKKFEKAYPKVSLAGFDTPNAEHQSWATSDFIRVAEYWRRVPVTRKLALFSDGSTDYSDDLDLDKINAVRAEQQMPPIQIVQEREVETHKVKWARITGTAIIDEGDWEGRWIPLIPVIGEEVEVGDEIYRHGLIHHATDAQKSYNYARSAMVEHIGNQPKAPWLATADQLKNYKSMWENANKGNPPVLIYDNDPQAPPPQRQPPPQLPVAWYQEAQVADQDMKATTGIYDASLGKQGNETSGRAIIARDQQGETATYVFVDNQVASIRLCGLMLVDLIPHIISEERIIRIIGEDGSIESYAKVNTRLPDGTTFNDLSQGDYDVEVTTGPAYATKRQMAADSMMQFSQAVPIAGQVAGDLIAKSMDWPNADKIAKRLLMLLPPGMDPEADKARAEAQQDQPQQPPPPSPEQMAMQADQQTQQAKLQLEAETQSQRLELLAQDQAAKQALARDQFEFEAAMALNKHQLAAEIAAHGAALKTGQAMHGAALDVAAQAHDQALGEQSQAHSQALSEQAAEQAAEQPTGA
jgi:hypothetical protein